MTSSEAVPAPAFDRVAATLAALVVVGLAVFLLVRNEEIADARLFFILRVAVSFSTAVLGATIPGFLNFSWSGGGLVVRAGGALALFALTFFYTPDLVVRDAAAPASRVDQTSTGDVSPPIVNNSGTVVIDSDAAK